MALEPGATLGSYEILSLLGAGGMGQVYLARDVSLGRRVALKVLPPEFTNDAQRVVRFEQEARSASALSHPNICTIFALGEVPDGRRFIAMEYIDGQTLRHRLKAERVSLREALDISSQIAAGVSAAHALGIVHRDLKPENVIIRQDGLVKVVDFGLAKLTRADDAEGRGTTYLEAKTDPGSAVGTITYMSPEQARAQQVDARTDIWSLGVLLYEMVAGRSPFAGTSSSDVVAAILDRDPPPLARFDPDAPAELQRMVSKALRKDREQRYQVMKDLRLDLQALRDELAGQTRSNPTDALPPGPVPIARPTPAPTSTGSTSRRSSAEVVITGIASHKLSAALGACVLALIVGGAWWAGRNRGTGSELGRSSAPVHRNLTRLTFGSGLQTDVTWSPDGQSIAFASDQAGNFDIWVQPVNEATPVQVTRSAAHDTQPTWSPDGSTIVFRSERDGGGLFVVPATGGLERRLTTFGVRPTWAPDGSQVLFGFTELARNIAVPRLYVVGLDGRPPKQILQQFTDSLLGLQLWAWHPDRRHVSVIAQSRAHGHGLFLVPVTGSPTAVAKISLRAETGATRDFASHEWSPRANAVYAAAVERGLTDLWRFAIDPQSLKQVAAERLTTGGGLHRGPAMSPEGTRLAFTTETQSLRLWSVGLDAAGRRVGGEARPITDAGAQVGTSDLARDGRMLAYVLGRQGTDRTELWVTDLQTRRTQVLASDDQQRNLPQWSPDGTRLAYHWTRWKDRAHSAEEAAVVIRRTRGGEEETVARWEGYARRRNNIVPWDWSPDGQSLLVGSDLSTPPHFSLHLLPLAAAPHAETAATRVASDRKYSLWQASFSPNGRWIAFVAQNLEEVGVATVAVMPSSGGDSTQWTHVTNVHGWADKPRWSPDGKLLYFILLESSFFNVWAVQFDSETGKTVGAPFQVTRFVGPGRRAFANVGNIELGVSADRLVLPILETTGSIWMLDNVDR